MICNSGTIKRLFDLESAMSNYIKNVTCLFYMGYYSGVYQFETHNKSWVFLWDVAKTCT